MTDLKPGQELTYEQVMSLPDGAVFTMTISHYCYGTVGEPLTVEKKNGDYFIGSMNQISIKEKHNWAGYYDDPVIGAPYWHSARLVSLPPQPAPSNIDPHFLVNVCDRCGTTYKNDERHACFAREPSESSPGDGYRWLVTRVDVLRSGDEWKNQNGKFAPIPVWCVGGVADGAIMFRRRIEPQAEPAKPERQASEIEKRAALTALGPLFEDCHDAMRDATAERDYGYLYDFWTNIEGTFRRYREMYDYARSIGAIE